jgi:pimeloyl-ACP methyl ester carboxylesterase
MEDRDRQQLLAKLAAARGIAFRTELLPSRRYEQLSKMRLSALHWSGRGAPLLLLHGGALSAHTWDLLCMALGEDAECMALDLPGHGHSGWLDSYSIDSGVSEVAEFVERVGWSTLHVAGMSLGGNIAFHFAATHPQRIRSLAIVDIGPKINLRASDNMRQFLSSADQYSKFEDLVAAACAVSSRNDPDLLRYRYQSLVQVNRDGSWIWLQDRRPHDFEDTFGKLRGMPSLASRIHCPVLIVRGGRSLVITDEDAGQFASMFERGGVVIVPDAGHNVQEDNPSALAEALRSHIRSAEI